MSFAAADGRITGLLGPNGAGKSTCLRILSTVIEADSGSARVGGIDLTASPLAARRTLGVLPHSSGLYNHLTGRENIEYYGRLHGIGEEALATRVDALVERLDLGSIAGRKAKGFSQGERTKIALARALVHDPQHLLLDEPTNGLDVMATRHLRDWLRELRGQGRCVLLSSHVMQEVEALVDDLVIIAAGRVTLSGTPAELEAALSGPQPRGDFRRSRARRGAQRRMSTLVTVCRKELLETMRERRTLVSLLLGPLFGPLLFAVLINMTVSRSVSSLEEVLEVPILGAERAPNLMAHLQARNIKGLDSHDVASLDEAAELVATGVHDVVLVIDEAFGSDFGTERAARVALVFDRSKSRAASRVGSACAAPSRPMGSRSACCG